MVEFRPHELVPNDCLDLGIVSGKFVFGQLPVVHVRGQRSVQDWGSGLRNHLNPFTDVMVVNFFHDVIHFELHRAGQRPSDK